MRRHPGMWMTRISPSDREHGGRQPKRVLELAAAHECALLHPLQRQLLDRSARPVGVEPDLAEEDPVGPGDRALAHLDRVPAVEAVRELAQAFLDLARAAPGAGLDRRV